MRTLVKYGIAGVAVIVASAVVAFAADDSAPQREPTHSAAASSVRLDYQSSRPHPPIGPDRATGSSPGTTDQRQQNVQQPPPQGQQQVPQQQDPQQPQGQQAPGQTYPQGKGSQQLPPAPDGGPNCDLGAPCDSHYGPPQQGGPSNVGPDPNEAPYQPPGSAGDQWARDQYCDAMGLPPGCI